MKLSATRKILSTLLAWILTFSSLPLSVIAENIAIKQETNENTSEESLATDEDVFIVQEDPTKRGEFEKHYICSDGTYVVASYAEAIHYKDDNGEWVDVDNRPVQTTEGDYTARNGNFGISVPSSTGDGHLMRMDKGEHSLSWTLSANKKAGTIKMDSNVSTMAPKPVQSQKMEVGTAKHPEIIVSNTEQPRENHKVLRDEATFDLPNVSGKVRYDDLFGADQGVSVVYTTYRNKIEEDIYIEKPTDITSFSMEVEAPNLIPRLNADNSVDFLDNDGKMCYHVGIPYMMDADFAVLNDIETTVTSSGDAWIITYIPDVAWFTSEERVYPILLDPSITTNEYRTNIQDTYVEEGDSTVHSSEQLLYINGGTGNRKAIIRFLTLPAIDDTMPLISAKLDFSSQYAPFSDVGLTLSYVSGNRSIGISAYTYEDANITADFSFSSFLSIGQTGISFDLTNNIYDILEGTGDFVLGYSADGDTTFCYPFHSTDSTTGTGPVLTITYGYSLPDGVADGAILALQNYGSTLFASVTGNNPAENANVYQAERNNWIPTTNELFRLQYNAETGAYRLYSMASNSGTNRMLTVYTSSNGLIYGSRNVRLEDLDDNSEISQDWMIISHDGTTFRLLPRSNMSVCLTANGDTEGTSLGTGTGSAGNVCVKTVDTNSDYQLWWLIKNDGAGSICTSEFSPITLDNGLYYFINRYSGRYLYQNGSTAMSTRGFITDTRANNNVSNTSASLYQVYREFISWRITNLGDGYCTIQNPISMNYLYAQTDNKGAIHSNRYVKIGNMDENIPDNFKWTVYAAPGGGMIFKSKVGEYYLTLNETSLQTRNANIRMCDKYGPTSTNFGQQVWRVFKKDDYVEPNGAFSLSISAMDIGKPQKPLIDDPINSSLNKSSDFYYSERFPGYVSFDQVNGTISGKMSGIVTIFATHKTTGYSYMFWGYVNKNAIIIVPGFMASVLVAGEDFPTSEYYPDNWNREIHSSSALETISTGMEEFGESFNSLIEDIKDDLPDVYSIEETIEEWTTQCDNDEALRAAMQALILYVSLICDTEGNPCYDVVPATFDDTECPDCNNVRCSECYELQCPICANIRCHDCGILQCSNCASIRCFDCYEMQCSNCADKTCSNCDDQYGYGNLFKQLYNDLKQLTNVGQPYEGYETTMFFYDWRQSCADSAVDLNNFIIENEYDKIVLVAHSMGGLVSSGYMALGATQRDKIEKYVSYGTPYLGSVAAPMVCLTGMFEAMTGDIDFDDNDGHGQTELGEKSILLETIAHSLVKNVVVPFLAANFASVYELFPSEKYFEYIGPYLTNERLLDEFVTNEEHLLTTYDETILSIRASMRRCNRDMLDSAAVFHRNLYQNNQHITTLVDSTYVYSTGEHTATHIVLHDDLIYRYTNYFSEVGDEVVHSGSATIGHSSQEYLTVNVGHSSLIKSDYNHWKEIFGYLEG